MKAMKFFDVCRTALIVLLTAVVLTGTCRTSWSETYMCTQPAHLGATCTMEGDIEEGAQVTFTCKTPSGEPSDKTCSRLYSPIFGETFTGTRGFNWLCDGSLTVHDSLLKDKKSMCAKLCGICEGAWK